MTWGSAWPAIWESDGMVTGVQRCPAALKILALSWLLLPAGTTLAQQEPSAGQEPSAEQESSAEPDDSSSDEADSSVLDQPGGVESASEAAEDDDESEGPGRFIPSEQISQDLGVSFPADI